MLNDLWFIVFILGLNVFSGLMCNIVLPQMMIYSLIRFLELRGFQNHFKLSWIHL